MKEIKWQQCLGHGALGSYPHRGGKMRNPLDAVQAGMHVSAKHGGVYVHLRIQDATDQQNLTAEVLYFEPALTGKPEDVNQGDTVVIDRDHVCFTFDD